MNALFRGGPYLDVRTRDGLNFVLLAEKEVVVEEDDGQMTRYLMPIQTDSDGASIPAPGQLFGLDHYGDYWPGAYFHDCAFRRKLLVWSASANLWVKAPMDEPRANLLLKALMFGLGTDEIKRDVIYNALVLFGKKAWDEDGKAVNAS